MTKMQNIVYILKTYYQDGKAKTHFPISTF